MRTVNDEPASSAANAPKLRISLAHCKPAKAGNALPLASRGVALAPIQRTEVPQARPSKPRPPFLLHRGIRYRPAVTAHVTEAGAREAFGEHSRARPARELVQEIPGSLHFQPPRHEVLEASPEVGSHVAGQPARRSRGGDTSGGETRSPRARYPSLGYTATGPRTMRLRPGRWYGDRSAPARSDPRRSCWLETNEPSRRSAAALADHGSNRTGRYKK